LKKRTTPFALIILSVMFLASCTQNPIQPESEDDQLSAGDPFARNKRLGRGVNLGNALEAPNEGEWGVVLESRYFDLIKSAGFSSVRIPIRWSAHTSVMAPYEIETDFLQRVDWAIEQAFSRNLAVIINIHHFDQIMQFPAGQKTRFLAIWKQLAGHYRDYSEDLFFELLNEPNSSLTPELWNQYLAEAIAVIRESNPERTLLVCPAIWSGVWALQFLELPAAENNIIVTFHYYNPFPFTHQGAEWIAGSDAWLGTQWLGEDSEKQSVLTDFFTATDWAKANNRPLNLGEFGAYSKADMASRARWTAFVVRTAEENEISWHYWEFIAGFGVFNASQNDWNTPLLNALFPPVNQ
jgi:endoglucanase